MLGSRKQADAGDLNKAILDTAEEMYGLLLDGKLTEGRRLRRSLVSRILRELKEKPGTTRLWCMLGDLYTHRAKRMDCYREALRIEPSDPESNAEIARLYAHQNDRRYKRHFDRTLEFCRGVDIEESIIYSALEAARAARDSEREQRAIRLGRRRFPDCSLFE